MHPIALTEPAGLKGRLLRLNPLSRSCWQLYAQSACNTAKSSKTYCTWDSRIMAVTRCSHSSTVPTGIVHNNLGSLSWSALTAVTFTVDSQFLAYCQRCSTVLEVCQSALHCDQLCMTTTMCRHQGRQQTSIQCTCSAASSLLCCRVLRPCNIGSIGPAGSSRLIDSVCCRLQ